MLNSSELKCSYCVTEKLINVSFIIPDCLDGVARGVEEEGCRDGVDGTALHVPARVGEVSGDNLEVELCCGVVDGGGGVDVGEGERAGDVGGLEAVDQAVRPRVEAVLVPAKKRISMNLWIRRDPV